MQNWICIHPPFIFNSTVLVHFIPRRKICYASSLRSSCFFIVLLLRIIPPFIFILLHIDIYSPTRSQTPAPSSALPTPPVTATSPSEQQRATPEADIDIRMSDIAVCISFPLMRGFRNVRYVTRCSIQMCTGRGQCEFEIEWQCGSLLRLVFALVTYWLRRTRPPFRRRI